MKLIHCADLHLDSSLRSNLDPDKVKERKTELLDTFVRLSDYAQENGVGHVIIAGDLFDKKNVSARAKNTVYGIIERHPDISYYYLKGNHDEAGEDGYPDNLFLFFDEWKYYRVPLNGNRDTVIAGIELTDENSGDFYDHLSLRPQDINIVTLHGQISEYAPKDRAGIISLNRLKNRSIDYMALGHVHEHQSGLLPPRGEFVYPGCLEGRGFDECGEHGFELIDIDDSASSAPVSHRFVPFAKRRLFTLPVDVTGVMTTVEITDLVRAAIEDSGVNSSDMLKICLVGKVDVECEKDVEQIRQRFERDFYFLKAVDETSLAVDYESFARDATLKGEFVRLLQAEKGLSEEKRSAIIRCGIHALSGEEWQ